MNDQAAQTVFGEQLVAGTRAGAGRWFFHCMPSVEKDQMLGPWAVEVSASHTSGSEAVDIGNGGSLDSSPDLPLQHSTKTDGSTTSRYPWSSAGG